MKKTWKRLCTGFLALATVVTALPTTPVHAESKQYWTESKERVGIVEKVMNDGSIGSTFNEGHLTVEGEDAYCIDINTDFRNGYKTRADASTRMSADQISDVALSIEYVKQYTDSHSGISKNHAYLLRQLVVWQRLSVHLGWQCDNVRASYDEIPKATQDEVFSGAKAFVKENKGRYECGGYIYSGEGQELGQFWAKLNVGNAKLQKTSSNTSITDGNGNYSVAGATYGVFSDKDCTKQLATLTTDENGNTDVVEVKAGTVYIKELSAPAGYKVDKTVYSLKVEAGKTATLKVSDTPKVTDTLIELFKIDMETQKDNPQGNASLAGAEFTWKYYAGFYNKDNLPAEATRTWVTKTIAETDSDGTTHYITKLADAYKVSGDSFYMQDGKAVLPLGTLTVASKARTMSFTFGTLSMLILISLLALNYSSINKASYDISVNLNAPYDVQLFDDKQVFDEYIRVIEEEYTIDNTIEYDIYKEPNHQVQNFFQSEYYDFDPVLKLSDYNRLLELRKMPLLSLNDNEYYIVTNSKFAYEVEDNKDIETITVANKNLKLKGYDTKSYWNSITNTGRFVVVLPDKYVQGLEVSENHLIIDTKEDTDAELENKIKEDMQHQLVKVDENGEINDESYRVNVRGAEIEQQKAMVAIVVSLFMYIAFILISAVGTILAVQSLSDSTKYKYRYLTLRRLGINDKSLFKTIRKQLLILFCVPAISAILCSFVMMSSLNNVYQQILGDKHLYLMYFGLNLIIFFLIYSIYWIATYIGFKRNINEES